MSLRTMSRTNPSTDHPASSTTGLRRRWLQPVIVGALIAAGTGAVVVSTRSPAPVLVSDGEGRISLIDVGTGEATYTATDAVKAAASSTILRAQTEGDFTAVETLEPASGEVVASTRVDGKLEIRAVSPFGGVVALMEERPDSNLYVPEPRESTSITVIWNEGTESQTYTLEGNYEPETFSTDEETLFLLEFFPPADPDRYFVRQLDLLSGEITSVETSDQELGIELNPEMRGHARAQAMASDGSYLFSLYTIGQGETPVHDPADPETDRWAFVHTLNLE
jgi:hypothetical protein